MEGSARSKRKKLISETVFKKQRGGREGGKKGRREGGRGARGVRGLMAI